MSCNYDRDGSSQLQHSGEIAFVLEPSAPSGGITTEHGPRKPPTPPSEKFLNMLNHPLALHETEEVYRITESDLDMFGTG